jgi:hypothetical protein
MTQQLEEKMKKIINGKLYDSDKAEKICEAWVTGLFMNVKGTLYRTKSKNWFIVSETYELVKLDESTVKRVLGSQNVAQYIKLFGKVEEA